MSELKQCPKCGPNGAPLRRIGEMDEYRVECIECYTVKTPWFKTPGEAEAYWNAFAEGMKLQAARIAELEKEKSELLAKCEKYECEIGLAKQQIAALESKSNMYIDLSVAMASTARKVDGLEKERDRLREALKEIAEFADSECGKRIPAPSCVEFLTINRYAEKALKGTGECRK